MSLLDDGTVTGADLRSFVRIEPVPEPASGWLLAAGLLGLAFLRRRLA